MSPAYPYAGRDLFAAPPSYSFAACAGADFLDGWRSSRLAARDALLARSAEPAADRRRPRPPAGAIDLYDALEDLSEGLANGRYDIAHAIDRLAPFVVKYEVFQRLFAWYGPDGRRHPESPPASPGAYVLFAHCLAEASDRAGSLKHLSTLLKVCDALASLGPDAFAPPEAGRLADVLDREFLLVKRVTESP